MIAHSRLNGISSFVVCCLFDGHLQTKFFVVFLFYFCLRLVVINIKNDLSYMHTLSFLENIV
jgi:hypothetical protein